MKNINIFSFFALSLLTLSLISMEDKEKLINESDIEMSGLSYVKESIPITVWKGFKPIHTAAYNHLLDEMKSLLKHGADVNEQINRPFKKQIRNTPIYKPYKSYSTTVVETSEDDTKYSEVTQSVREINTSTTKYKLSGEINANLAQNDPPLFQGFTALHFAILVSTGGSVDLKIIKQLLHHGADYTIPDVDGKLPKEKALNPKTFEIIDKVYSYTDLLYFALKNRKYENIANIMSSIVNDDMCFILKHFKVKDKKEYKPFSKFARKPSQLNALLKKGADVKIDLKRFKDVEL